MHGRKQPSTDQVLPDLSLFCGTSAHGFFGGGIFTSISALPETSFWTCCFRLTVGVTCIITDGHFGIPRRSCLGISQTFAFSTWS